MPFATLIILPGLSYSYEYVPAGVSTDFTSVVVRFSAALFVSAIYGTALQPYPLNKEWTLKQYRICSVTQTQDLQ